MKNSNKVELGDRVEIKAGANKGGWGIVNQIVGEDWEMSSSECDYHVGISGDPNNTLIFRRREIAKKRNG